MSQLKARLDALMGEQYTAGGTFRTLNYLTNATMHEKIFRTQWILEMLILIAGAVLGLIASILANVLTGPILSLASRHRIVAALARLPFVSDRRLKGEWRVCWTVTSLGYQPENEGSTRIASAFSMLAFSTTATGYDVSREYLYVGHSKGGIVSGRWYDPGPDAYHGMFQIRWNGTCTAASGKWIGWASDGTIKVGNLELSR